MLPIDGRQLENVKGELLKLKKKYRHPGYAGLVDRWRNRRTKKSDMSRHGTTGREKSLQETKNKEQSDYKPGTRRGRRRAEETEAIKEIAD
ncbi:hypothetical protein AVEN_144564-1 [Araneus ventricosus]|uniref:Uncharacterized protein n=1 Tax=Araneus ventricosus TaxID=182803 RepID=A0A4Y2SPA5_ARAVE|nr:hypothetical protein AVEN_144564-1 [Araneus ventricosus]